MVDKPVFATDLDPAAAGALLAGWGEPRYRAGQLLDWVYKRHAASFADMTSFPKPLREKLAGELRLASVAPVQVQTARDGTTKALLALADGETIEAVLMPGTRAGGFTVCLSTQVGCVVCCPFWRSMTISTAGLVPGIEKLAAQSLQVGLAVSLHAPNNALRDQLVPLNRKYPLEALLAACRRYVARSGRRVSFEYCLFAGINDSLLLARELAHLLRGLNAHVNLIAANESCTGYGPPPREAVLAFENELLRLGLNATLRRSLGRDIQAACGQLKSQARA